MRNLHLAIITLATLVAVPDVSFAQPAPPEAAKQLRKGLNQLNDQIADLKASSARPRDIADVEIFAKGVEWCVRHDEFYANRKKPEAPSGWVKYCETAIATGIQRATDLKAGKRPWSRIAGSTIRGYVSRVDGSTQPYAVSLPDEMNGVPSGYRFPLHVKLHGRGGTRNEVRFFNEHQGKKPQDGQNWIQLDVFGRTDNAYRWSGETDVFEAIADVSRRFRVDRQRITLWGFSMGGAGAWHLGVHHPSIWSSVGPGAGFVDFYKYQKQTELRPPHQHRGLHIYDSIDYALNMFNVPFCTYGGELDAQLVASTKMIERGKELGVDAKLLIGPGMGHKFHPDSYKEFMAFHVARSTEGRPRFPGRKQIRFVTWTLKYNKCEWLTIEEMVKPYEETLAEGGLDDDGVLRLTTKNIAALRIARDLADNVELDGISLPLRSAAEELLPDVYFEKTGKEWALLSYDDSVSFADNPGGHKRRNLQGPIDDAFMEPFVCVRATGKAWSEETQSRADASLQLFEKEFDKWLRGRVRVITDKQVTDEHIANSNLILFGDPGSNSVMAKVVMPDFARSLPIRWTEEGFQVNGESYDSKTHQLSMIYPNPLNPSRYVVINSGHTMHEKDFRASNSWLFPKLGDIAVQKFPEGVTDPTKATTVWADMFDSNWQLSVQK